MPASLSQINRFGMAPSCPEISDHMPRSRSGVVRDGNITAVMNRENEDTTTNTGGDPAWPAPSGILTGVTALAEIPQFCSPKFPTPGRFRT